MYLVFRLGATATQKFFFQKTDLTEVLCQCSSVTCTTIAIDTQWDIMRGVASLRPAQGCSSFEKANLERLNPGSGPNAISTYMAVPIHPLTLICKRFAFKVK